MVEADDTEGNASAKTGTENNQIVLSCLLYQAGSGNRKFDHHFFFKQLFAHA